MGQKNANYVYLFFAFSFYFSNLSRERSREKISKYFFCCFMHSYKNHFYIFSIIFLDAFVRVATDAEEWNSPTFPGIFHENPSLGGLMRSRDAEGKTNVAHTNFLYSNHD